MTKATAEGTYDAGTSDPIAIARDHARWTALMPGVIRAKVVDDGTVEWRIQSPAGEAVVRFRSTLDDGELRYESVSAESPFTGMTMSVVARDGQVTLDLAIESDPPFPPPMVEQLASAALMRVLDIAKRGTEPAPSAEREALFVPMSDGKRLHAHLYRTSADVAPCIVTLFPYRKEGAFLPQIATDLNGWGYHFLIADVRGIGGSDGPYEGLWSAREIDDFVELIEWAAGRGFCDGNAATFGGSYCGGNQLLVAARKPRGLRCITPIVGMVDTYRDWTHRGGIASHANWGAMTYLRSQHRDTARRGLEQYYLDFFLSDFDDDAHRARSPEYGLEKIEVPVLSIGGWHDYFLRGTARTFLLAGARDRRLVIGPWGHGDAPPLDELRRWFDRWLRDEGELPDTRVRLYVTGVDEWVELDDWPSPRREAWHPSSEPTALRVLPLVEALPMATNVKLQFVPDPTDSGFSVWSEDVTFETDPFTEPRTIIGHVGCTLHLSVDGCDDADVRVRLSVVRRDGPVVQLNEGRLRLSHRAIDETRSIVADGEVIVPWHTHVGAEPLEGAFDAHVEIDPIAHRFDVGDRLRLGITLTRADEGVEVARAVLDPASRLLLPVE